MRCGRPGRRRTLTGGAGRLITMEEQPLTGGSTGGAVLVGGTVRRPAGPWTPAVHALLRHLEGHGFDGAPRVLGTDEQDREVLTYLRGTTVGQLRPWPAWVHSDEALEQVGRWLRRYHNAVTDFVPPADAQWRASQRRWQPGDVIGHNDAAPYNAVWQERPRPGPEAAVGQLIGFIDWDFATPGPALRDLAFVAFSWVPLHVRDVAAADGFTDFTDFADRPRRLRLLLDAYGCPADLDTVLDAVRTRISKHAEGLRKLAAAGDPPFVRLVELGVIDDLDRALTQLDDDAARFCVTTCAAAPMPPPGPLTGRTKSGVSPPLRPAGTSQVEDGTGRSPRSRSYTQAPHLPVRTSPP